MTDLAKDSAFPKTEALGLLHPEFLSNRVLENEIEKYSLQRQQNFREASLSLW
jgi:hypothetical protein